MKKLEKLVLLDSHAILHRAYHALPDFSSSKGEPTGGLYGLVSMLIRIINDIKPDYIVAAYDLPEPTFRKQLYDEYKSGRKKADENLVSQIVRSRDIFEAFNIPVYDAPGFEADDVIGTLVELTKKNKKLQVIIASGDMDTLQLVEDDRVVVYTLRKGIADTVVYNEKAVQERFGFGPELLPDYKGLRGDPSDNIIGIAGIGEKTATELITKFGSIELIYKTLKKNRETLLQEGIKERIVKLLEEGEEEALFSKTLATIRRDAPIPFTLPDLRWNDSVDLAKVDKLFAELEFRTLGTRVKAALGGKGEIVQSSSAPTAGEPEAEEPDPESELPAPATVAIALWLLNSDLTMPTERDVRQFTGTESLEAAREILLKQIEEKGLERVYREIELPLIPIIKKAEERGILIDVPYLKQLSVEYHQKLDECAKKIYEHAGVEFNINSPKQLGEVLFDKLQLTAKGLKRTAGGARSTRESELVKLAEYHPIVNEILQYRELAKLVSTYIDTIPTLVDSGNRLHTHLHQTGTTTGRMSSSNPNLQNIPSGAEHGQRIRQAFLATPGFVWADFDYSQIEMRVLALLSGDAELTRIFQSGEDIHTGVAARVFKVSPAEVTKEMRRKAKVINFGIIYGMGVNALKINLGSSREEAQDFYNNFFATFPTIRQYFDKVKQEALERGYTETFFGRRRYFPGLKSKLPQIKAMSERMAMNAPLQGTAADIVKKAMIAVDDKIRAEKLEGQVNLLLQVHDELIYEIKEDKAEIASKLIQAAMEGVMSETPIPFTTSVGLGPNWAEAK